MNRIEKALMHALFIHLHHNIDKAIDFKAIEALNKKVGKLFQVAKKDVAPVLKAIRGKAVRAEVIGEINDDDKEVFEYRGKTVAVIPNAPSEVDLKELAVG